MKSDHAPIGRVFRSVEGESTRVGETTMFAHVADGVVRCAGWLSDEVSRRGIAACQRVVLDTCEASYLDWTVFAETFLDMVAHACPRVSILETRGERVLDRDKLQASLYLHLTPGLTILRPNDLRRGDEIKMLVHDPEEVDEAMRELQPYSDSGLLCFLLPRVGGCSMRLAAFYQRFLTHTERTPIRMMLVEHEVAGVE